MEKFSLMLDQFFGYFDLMATMFSLAIIFMVIANSLSFLRNRNDAAQMFYLAIVLVAAMFSALGYLLADLNQASTYSVYLAFVFAGCSICVAFWVAFTKKKAHYILASSLFYVSNVLAYLVMHF